MRSRSLLLCAVMLTVAVTSLTSPAFATMRIAEDRGGQIGHYLQAFAMLRSSGERVVIDGNCLSACTLVLGIIPRNRICATSRARFGFHAAWMPDVDGQPVTSPMGTQALWNLYPKRVRRWINRNGGLSRKMIYMQGRDLRGIVSYCGQKTRSADIQSDSLDARRTNTHSKTRARTRAETRAKTRARTHAETRAKTRARARAKARARARQQARIEARHRARLERYYSRRPVRYTGTSAARNRR